MEGAKNGVRRLYKSEPLKCWKKAKEIRSMIYRDMCAYTKNYIGSMLTNRFYFGGPFPKPTFCLQMHICDNHARWYQLVSEHYNVPFFSIDVPMWIEDEQGPLHKK